MNAGSLLVANFVAVLLAVALLGMVVRGHAWRCWSFTTYLAVALLSNRLVCWWPEHFFRLWFASIKELTYAALMILITIDLASVSLSRFRRARRHAIILAAAIGGTVALLLSTTTTTQGLQARVGITTALANGGALLALTGLLVVVHWYHLPLEPWHRVIALGIVLYRGVYGVLLGAVGLFGLGAYGYLATLDPAAYAATVGLWAITAWRPERARSVVAERARSLS